MAQWRQLRRGIDGHQMSARRAAGVGLQDRYIPPKPCKEVPPLLPNECSSCGSLNPYGLGEKAPKACAYCGSAYRYEDIRDTSVRVW